jgi:hypothetical protein
VGLLGVIIKSLLLLDSGIEAGLGRCALGCVVDSFGNFCERCNVG